MLPYLFLECCFFPLRGKVEILKYLLSKGSKLSTQNNKGDTAMHAAILGGSEDCVKLLLDHCTPDDLQIQV